MVEVPDPLAEVAVVVVVEVHAVVVEDVGVEIS